MGGNSAMSAGVAGDPEEGLAVDWDCTKRAGLRPGMCSLDLASGASAQVS